MIATRASGIFLLVLLTLFTGALSGTVFQLFRPDSVGFAAPAHNAAPNLAESEVNRGAPGSLLAQANSNLLTTQTLGGMEVQVRAEVRASGNAQANAQALGPGDTEAKVNTVGEGDAQAIAVSTGADESAQAAAAPAAQVGPTNNSVQNFSTAALPDNARILINEPLVNVRSGPSVGYTVLGQVIRGDQFTVVGRTADSSWWKICCVSDQEVWVIAAATNLLNPNIAIAVVDTGLPPLFIPATAPPPTATPEPTPTPSATPVIFPFDLVEQQQFAEQITPRLYVYVADEKGGLDGYTVRIRKDGTPLPVESQTFFGPPAYTWPLPIERQRFYNLKLEFATINPAGLWEVELLDRNGLVVGPPTTFTLINGEPNQELYLHYRLRK
jgi:uncharacterized protein YraI